MSFIHETGEGVEIAMKIHPFRNGQTYFKLKAKYERGWGIKKRKETFF